MRTPLLIIVLSELCLAIRVPPNWGSDSEVRIDSNEQLKPDQSAVPKEYFVYTAPKPQFAAEIADFHGVKNPEQHYKSYPIRPYTGLNKPELGKHRLLYESEENVHPLQKFMKSEALRDSPAAINYEVYHPYKAEEPGLIEIYKDPVLEKIRDDIRNSQSRLQKYENEAGKPNIDQSEYLESPEEIDRKKTPQENVPALYEVHRPQKRPVYYQPIPVYNHRQNILNQKFKLPWYHYNAKVKPLHYRPLKGHLQMLRQQQAQKYTDGNEYPQLPLPQNYGEPIDGYDIYERGREKYAKLRNNVDEYIDKSVRENKPQLYQKLEIQNNGDKSQTVIGDNEDEKEDEEEEFIPIKNYAQVRRTETTKHLPRLAAFDDADNFDEIKNAPRLKEAVKSTKAHTVYTEEGYEDAAYDHAGEQKHAAESEGHGGYLKENELSGGKYKIPSVSAAYQDAAGNEYRDQVHHGEKWKNDDKDKEEQTDAEDYSEDEIEQSVEADVYETVNGDRNKREQEADKNESEHSDEQSTEASEESSKEVLRQHELNKRETSFKVPEVNLTSTYLTDEDIDRINKKKSVTRKKENLSDKYPYYFKNLETVHRDSPLRYAENLKLIPKKSRGGSEFYDSRSNFQCSEVDEEVDAIPEKLKKNGHPDEHEDDSNQQGQDKKVQSSTNKNVNPRLKGLGDKIDCFKVKFFGENPLDSPFFKEDTISNPEPVTIPNLDAYILKSKEPLTAETRLSDMFNFSKIPKPANISDLVNKIKTNSVLESLINGQRKLQDSLVKTNSNLRSSLEPPQNITGTKKIFPTQQSHLYDDVLEIIKKDLQPLQNKGSVTKTSYNLAPSSPNRNITYISYHNKEDVTRAMPTVRKKRAVPFVYEPYKIIRNGQVVETKRTTSTNKVSPLIKQLQSSKFIDRSTKENEDLIKQNITSRTYKDIGKKDREHTSNQRKEPSPSPTFIDVNEDKRRGEPRYELRTENHKSEYTPIENKKIMSLEDYMARTTQIKNITEQEIPNSTEKNLVGTTLRPLENAYFDVSQYLPKTQEIQRMSASNTVNKVIKTSASPEKVDGHSHVTKSQENDDGDEYEEYDDEEEVTTTTTTTTVKPAFRKRRTRLPVTTTTDAPKEESTEDELPRLRLVTRFREPSHKKVDHQPRQTESAKINKQSLKDPDPKYREKKKQSTQRTLVTDTKSYGNDDGHDDMKKEVDALIGVQQDMDEYTPRYEKEIEQKSSQRETRPTQSSEEEEEEESEEDEDNERYRDDDDESDENEEDDGSEEEDDDEEYEPEPQTTSTDTKKRVLIGTTEAPVSTTEARNAAIKEQKPIILKKKIEIHKELPTNRSSPHSSQFKQDFKEIEVIKQSPSGQRQRKPAKNVEALELYKDDKLAEEVNKLGAVEIFKQNLDLTKGPKHGGNYRSAKLIELQEDQNAPLHGGNLKALKEDTVASSSKNTRNIDTDGVLPARRLHGGNLKALNDVQRSRQNSRIARHETSGRSDDHVPTRNMHGGNLKSLQNRGRPRGSNLNEKLVEFDEDGQEENTHDDDTSRMHGGNFKSYGEDRGNDGFHGGNYRNAKLVQPNNKKEETAMTKSSEIQTNDKSRNGRSNAALLNTFAQAFPVLTTTPAYILDPSKRKYYYVDD